MSQRNFSYCAAALLAVFMVFAVSNGQSKPKSATEKPSARKASSRITVQIDKSSVKNGGTIIGTGKAPGGKAGYI